MVQFQPVQPLHLLKLLLDHVSCSKNYVIICLAKYALKNLTVYTTKQITLQYNTENNFTSTTEHIYV